MSIIQLAFYSNPSPLPTKASGGQVYIPGNGYVYHMFLQPGTFAVNEGPISVESLIVAGGGSGGQSPSVLTGGGGAGGVRIVTLSLVNGSSYPIVVGSGGLSPGTTVSSGSPSSAFGYESAGGGRGASSSPNTVRYNGGCGGGGVYAPSPYNGIGNVPRSNPIQGYPGGNGISPTLSGAGGGGGGSGGSGSNGSINGPANNAGPGGTGISTSGFAAPLFPGMPPDWTSAVGPTGLYGGGGGGGCALQPAPTSQTQATGGNGGGGNGKRYSPSVLESTSGVDYTGGGGGGGGGSNIRSGGIGIVIVRYLA